ncbi:hypothetical protein GF312_06675 [Candidatus Poribacteria bacterium]|nr:hypothetical protein [Candidatus Poribacteria bacterium]
MVKFNYNKILLCVLLFVFCSQMVLAQQEVTTGKDFGIGGRAMAMGGAFIGTASDSTALHWNPAGLSQIKRMEIYGALSHEKLEADTEYFGNPESTFVSKTKPNSFGLVIPIPTYRGGMAFGIGINRLQSYDSRIRFRGFNELSLDEDPEFGLLFIDELTKESGGLYVWDFGGAVEVAPGVSLGGTLSFINGQYDYDLSLDADDVENLDMDFDGISYRDTIQSDYFGVEGKIGILAQLGEKFSFGGTIGIPLDFTVEEYWSQESFYLYDDGVDESDFEEGIVDYDISRPFKFSGGIALKPVTGFTIATDISYTDWTQTEYSEPPSEDITNEVFIEEYKDTFQFRIGGEYTIPNAGLSLRAGYTIDPLPYEPEGMNIDTDRQYISFGMGMMLDEMLFLDAAYVRGFWKESSEDGIIVKDRSSNRIFLSAGYRF